MLCVKFIAVYRVVIVMMYLYKNIFEDFYHGIAVRISILSNYNGFSGN